MPTTVLKTLFGRSKREPSSPSPNARWSRGAEATIAGHDAHMDWSDWEVVAVDVPPGPLGIVLDGDCLTVAVVDEFCDLPDGRRGAIELHGGVPVGSVLMSVNDVELLATRKSLHEVGDVLRESAHLTRVMRFKVPPAAPATLLDAPAEPSTSEKQSLLAQMLASTWLAPTPECDTSSPVDDVEAAVRKPSATDAGTSTIAVAVKGPTLEPPSKPLSGKFVAIDVPPGPLGLNLDGAITDRSVVLGFIALPDGSRGALETHGGVKPGSVLVEINGESVAKLPLDTARTKLGALSGEPRRLVFRLPQSSAAAKQQSQRQLLEQQQQLKVARLTPSVRVRVDEDTAKRRRLELALVLKFDRRTIKRGECWFLLDAQWMQRWIAFVGQDGPLPGPISNDALLQPGWRERLSGDIPGDADTPRDGLESPRDYRCVNPMVWSILCELHGPGEAPVLPRYVVDVAAQIVDQESVVSILREPQPTAVALVQELFRKCRTEVVDS